MYDTNIWVEEGSLSDSMPYLPFTCGDAPECHDEDNPCGCPR